VRPPILTLKTGFGSFQDSTTDYLTTILLKVKLLIQRTFHSSYPRATQGTQHLLTRTIWVSCLSHFLLLLLHPRQICNGRCTRTPAFAEATAVKARICPQSKSCTLTNFWLRDSLHRDTAPVPATNFVTGDKFAALINFVPRHA